MEKPVAGSLCLECLNFHGKCFSLKVGIQKFLKLIEVGCLQVIKRQIDNQTLMLDLLHSYLSVQGVKLIFFSDSHLAPKLFKVVANSKKLVAIYKQNLFLMLSTFWIDPSKLNQEKDLQHATA